MIFEANGFDEISIIFFSIFKVLSDDFLKTIDVKLLLK